MDIKILLIMIVVVVWLCPVKEGLFIEDWATVDFTSIHNDKHKDMKQVHFKELMNNFGEIFPSGNRNAGGPQFYHYICSHKEDLTKDKFLLYNTFYCGVSGSPIDPGRGKVDDYVKVNHVDGRTFVGLYHRCCWPCLAEIMKYTKVEHHTISLKDGPYEHMVITIDDPCRKQDRFPSEVDSYQCVNKKTMNGIRTNSGRLIIAVLHEHELHNPEKHDSLLQPILDKCRERMATPVDQLRGGMGDIFVKVATI
tara:strand:+ start:476 stop:1231 length:756 start_codon:yes stop_codon:yes gene_type:complete